MSLRFLLPLLLVLFNLGISALGYLTIRNQLKTAIEQESMQYMHLELNKLQGLLTKALSKNDSALVRQIHSGKLSEPDLYALIFVDPKGKVVASNDARHLQQRWQLTGSDISENTVSEILNNQSSAVQIEDNREFIHGYISLCIRDLSKGFRGVSCGFTYYELNLKFRIDQALNWLFKQVLYIGISTTLGMLLFIGFLHILITKRVNIIRDNLEAWSQGEREKHIKVFGRDELHDIATKVNDLTSQFAKDESALIFNQQLNNAVIQSANFSMITTDSEGLITSINSTAERMLGYNKDELVQKKTPAIIHDIDEVIERAQQLSEELGEEIPPGFESFVAKARRGIVEERKWTYIRKDGTRFPVLLSVTALYDHTGKLNGFLGIASDITEQLKAEEKLEHLAYYDQLTSLPNRTLYRDRLEQAIKQAKRTGSEFAVLFIDLDKFKFVNDYYGHEVGDKLLARVAEILSQNVRESDTVCRLGGDEFTLILSNLHADRARQDISRICEKILNALCSPVETESHTLDIGASIGIALFPEHAQDISSLNKAADLAMYKAKDAGRGQYIFFSEDLVPD